MLSIRRAFTLLAAAVLLAACGSSSQTKSNAASTPSPAAAGGSAAGAGGKVAIASYKFAPPMISVRRGGSVTFTNQDATAHTATADAGPSFDTGTLQQGQSKAVSFAAAGTFRYHCVFHAFMTGSVVVS